MKINAPSVQALLRHSRAALQRRGWSLLALAALTLPSIPASAAQLKEARVTQVIRDVKLLPGQAAPRPATVSDPVREGTAVRTGLESRAELMFTDRTLARLGSNTIFSFDQGTRNLELGGGAMLLRVPKNSGGAQINTAAVTAAITGTTVMLEYHPDAFIKFIMLEGTGRIFRKGQVGESVLLRPGQMLIVNPNGTGLPDPVEVDLERLMETSLLINGFDPLPSGDLISKAISSQDALKKEGGLIETNLVIFGGGTTVALLDPTDTGVLDQANSNVLRQSGESPTPTPTPTVTPTPTITPTPTVSPPPPQKFGTPVVIASSTPYEIKSGTVIQTDPTITTNGRTDFGTIYRSAELDGPATLWFFGSTSEFDSSIGLTNENTFVGDRVPIAAFKFSSLQLTGDPTIVIGEGGPNNLALISVGDMTSGPPGGILTFGNVNFLFLATQDGSITLSSDLAFQDIPVLYIYARGAGSTLTFDAGLSGTTDLHLVSQGNVNATDSLIVSQANDGRTDGLNISLLAGGAINVGGDLDLTTDPSNLQSGGNLLVTSGGDITIGGVFSLQIAALSGSTTGTGGNITVNSSGSLTAGSLFFDLFFDDSSQVTDGENLSLNVDRDLTTTSGDVSLRLSTPVGAPLNSGGNLSIVVGGDLNIAVGQSLNMTLINTNSTAVGNGASLMASIGGDLNAGSVSLLIDNSGNGGIGTGGNLTLGVDGNLQVSDFLAELNNSAGGQIGTGGNISIEANNVDASSFAALIDNQGGQIGGSAFLSAVLSGNLLCSGDAFLQIMNQNGMIGGEAAISLSANNVQAFSLLALIDSGNGAIGSNATITFDIPGTLTTTTNATVDIALPPPSTQVAAATAIVLNGGSYEVGGTFHSTITGGDGGITIATAAIHADMIKIGAFGDNGSLTIGGGSISGDTLLKLYAPGSNGRIDFISNVTLNSGSSVIIAANAVTINNGVVVTITGDDGVNASVFTNFPNYTGSGGNGSTSGIFAGNGAQTAPLDQAPPFDNFLEKLANESTVAAATPAPMPATGPRGPGGSGAALPHRPRSVALARVSDSNDLLNLTEKVTSGPSEANKIRSSVPTRRTSGGAENVSLAQGRTLPSSRSGERTEMSTDRNLSRQPAMLP